MPGGEQRKAMDQSALLRAFEHFKAGRMEPAAELLREFLGGFPLDAPANHLLGGIYYPPGKHIAACEHLARACFPPRAPPERVNQHGARLKALGDSAGASGALRL